MASLFPQSLNGKRLNSKNPHFFGVLKSPRRQSTARHLAGCLSKVRHKALTPSGTRVAPQHRRGPLERELCGPKDCIFFFRPFKNPGEAGRWAGRGGGQGKISLASLSLPLPRSINPLQAGDICTARFLGSP